MAKDFFDCMMFGLIMTCILTIISFMALYDSGVVFDGTMFMIFFLLLWFGFAWLRFEGW